MVNSGYFRNVFSCSFLQKKILFELKCIATVVMLHNMACSGIAALVKASCVIIAGHFLYLNIFKIQRQSLRYRVLGAMF